MKPFFWYSSSEQRIPGLIGRLSTERYSVYCTVYSSYSSMAFGRSIYYRSVRGSILTVVTSLAMDGSTNSIHGLKWLLHTVTCSPFVVMVSCLTFTFSRNWSKSSSSFCSDLHKVVILNSQIAKCPKYSAKGSPHPQKLHYVSKSRWLSHTHNSSSLHTTLHTKPHPQSLATPTSIGHTHTQGLSHTHNQGTPHVHARIKPHPQARIKAHPQRLSHTHKQGLRHTHTQGSSHTHSTSETHTKHT
jgi:hypothetical protein